jgi:thiol-disulfide isomerase/thioredoxin
MINLIKKIIFPVFLIACNNSGCTPKLEEQTDTEEVVTEEEGYAFETWEECSQVPGEHPCNFTLQDHKGNDWTLYDNYEKVMVIDFSAMWCSVCANIAPDAQAFQDDYASQGFLWVTVLIDDEGGEEVDQSDLERWVDAYGMTTSPVLGGSRDMVDLTAEDGYPITSWPTLVVISREMVLANGINGWNESTIRAWVEQEL